MSTLSSPQIKEAQVLSSMGNPGNFPVIAARISRACASEAPGTIYDQLESLRDVKSAAVVLAAGAPPHGGNLRQGNGDLLGGRAPEGSPCATTSARLTSKVVSLPRSRLETSPMIPTTAKTRNA